MEPLAVLNQIQIASPCPAAWDEMSGDHRVRHCGTCRKNVYNLAVMTPEEALALIVAHEGELCARIYRRRDGTVLTADCPVGVRRAEGRRRRRLASALVVGLGTMIAGTAWAARLGSAPWRSISPPPTGPGVTFQDWSDWALEILGVRQRPVFAGGICAPPFAPAPVSPTGPTAEGLEAP